MTRHVARSLLWLLCLSAVPQFAFGQDGVDAEWTQYDGQLNQVRPAFPKRVGSASGGQWAQVPFDGDVDAAFVLSTNGLAYLFRGTDYDRVNLQTGQVDPGYPRRIGFDGWLGGPNGHFDAVVEHPSNGLVYFFKGDRYWRFDLATDRFKVGSRRIGIDGWFGVNAAPGWADGVDAAVPHAGNGKVYFFKGHEYLRYDLSSDSVDSGYPRNTAEFGWVGLRKDITAVLDRGGLQFDFFHPPATPRNLTAAFNLPALPPAALPGYDDTIHQAIISALDDAHVGSDVWLSVPGWDNTSLAQAVRNALDRGVNVRMITHREDTSNLQWWEVSSHVWNTLFNGAPGHEQNQIRSWRWGYEPGRIALGFTNLNHAKFALFESVAGSNTALSIVSSANWRWADQQRQNNATLIYNDDVYRHLTTLAERLFALAKNGTQATSSDWYKFGKTIEIDRNLEIYITPSANGQPSPVDPHLSLLDDVICMPWFYGPSEVWVAGSTWNNNGRGAQVVDRLAELKAEGCDVRVVGHWPPAGAWWKRETTQSVWNELHLAGIPLFSTNTHSKYIVVRALLASHQARRTAVVTGALNFSGSIAAGPNRSPMIEVGLTAYDDPIFDQYRANWLALASTAYSSTP